MGTAAAVDMFWAFVRYILNNSDQTIETMTKKDFIGYVEEFAAVNVELCVGTTEAGCYDDALVTTATAYTDVQLPGVTGVDLDSANTFAKKTVVFNAATYPRQDQAVAGHSTPPTHNNQRLYGL